MKQNDEGNRKKFLKRNYRDKNCFALCRLVSLFDLHCENV